jgi:acetyl-CoA synthetase (ADP-forming)
MEVSDVKSKALREVYEKGIRVLGESESRKVLEEYGIPCPKTVVIGYDEGKRAEEYLRELKSSSEWPGYPLFLKIVSPDIIHKSDAGVVKRVVSDDEALMAIETIIRNAKKYKADVSINGILASQDVSSPETRELLIGAVYNEHFGHLISLGIGGVLTEVYKDVEFRAIPITESDVYSMVSRLKGRAMLGPFRGMRPINMSVLVYVVLKLSKMIEENPEIREIDINPFIIGPERGFAVDARMRIE